jgi:hypothetical protein
MVAGGSAERKVLLIVDDCWLISLMNRVMTFVDNVLLSPIW